MGDSGESGVGVEVVDDGDFDGVGGELGSGLGVSFIECVGEEIVFGRKVEVWVVVGEEVGDFELEWVVGDVGEVGVELFEVFVCNVD